MFENFDLIIRNGLLVSHMGEIKADIGIKKGRISAIGDLSSDTADRYFDAHHLVVMPGVIDTRVRFCEPGETHREDMESGSRAAILGGVTTVFDQPVTGSQTLTAEMVNAKASAAKNRFWCDFAFYVGAVESTAKTLGWLEKTKGVAGVSIDLDGGRSNKDYAQNSRSAPLLDEDALYKIMQHGNRRITVQPENGSDLDFMSSMIKQGEPSSHSKWRGSDAAISGIERTLVAARRAGRRLHFASISTTEELFLLGRHKDIASLGITPHHLLCEGSQAYERLQNLAVTNPPLRSRDDIRAIRAAVSTGLVDLITSDHNPQNPAEKNQTYPDGPSGFPGVETILPLLLTEIAEGRMTFQHLIQLTSAGPARVFGLRDKGRLAIGYHADITIIDPKKRYVFSAKDMASKSGFSPFEDVEMTGKPVATIVRGHIVMQNNCLEGSAEGEAVRFQDSLKPDFRKLSERVEP